MPLRVHVAEGEQLLEVLDMCEEGIFIADNSDQLQPGDELELHVMTPRGRDGFRLQAEVRWCGDKAGIAGVGARLRLETPERLAHWRHVMPPWAQHPQQATSAALPRGQRRRRRVQHTV